MTLDQAFSQLSDSNKSYKLLEAGYKCVKCEYCKGFGKIWNRTEAVYHQCVDIGNIDCKNCSGEGRIWIAPIIK